MSNTLTIGSITIPVANIDYVDVENCWLKTKTGNRILLQNRTEAEWVARQL